MWAKEHLSLVKTEFEVVGRQPTPTENVREAGRHVNLSLGISVRERKVMLNVTSITVVGEVVR